MNSNSGSDGVICYLVGAGPGAPNLLTLRAKELFQTADVVLYDRLSSDVAEAHTPPHIEKIFIGDTDWQSPHEKFTENPLKKSIKTEKKTSKTSNVSNEEHPSLTLLLRVIQHLQKDFDTEKNNPSVPRPRRLLRLKGGDPFIFGRAYEELHALTQLGVPFEVIPGISSFQAAAISASIPLTQRGDGQTFSVLTGHFSDEAENDKRRVIANSDTVIYLMGVKNLEAIVQANIAAGKDPATPVAVIEHATTAEQRIRRATLTTLVTLHRKDPVRHPAIILIGPTAAVSPRLDESLRRPLAGARVLLLRRRVEFLELSTTLENLGARPLSLPLLQHEDLSHDIERFLHALESRSFSILLFTSKRAVTRVMTLLQDHGRDARLFADLQIMAIGSGTAECLRAYRISPDYTASEHAEASQEGLTELLRQTYKDKDNNDENRKILLPQAEKTRETLSNWMENEGIDFETFSLYATRTVKHDPREQPRYAALFLGATYLYITSESALSALSAFLRSLRPFLQSFLSSSLSSTPMPASAPLQPPPLTYPLTLPICLSMGERLHARVEQELKPLYKEIFEELRKSRMEQPPGKTISKDPPPLTGYFQCAAQPVSFQTLVETNIRIHHENRR